MNATVYTMTPSAWELTPRAQVAVSADGTASTLGFSLDVSPRGFSMVVIPGVQLADGVQTSLWQPLTGSTFAERHAALLEAERQEGHINAEALTRYSRAGTVKPTHSTLHKKMGKRASESLSFSSR